MYGIIVDFLVKMLADWLNRQREENKGKGEELDKASQILRSAITDTQIYLGRIRRGAERDFEAEADLARKWSQASRDIKRIDTEISERCYVLSKYWADPETPPEMLRFLGKPLFDLDELHHDSRLLGLITMNRDS